MSEAKPNRDLDAAQQRLESRQRDQGIGGNVIHPAEFDSARRDHHDEDDGAEVGDPRNPRDTLVDPGTYRVAFVRERRREMFGRVNWHLDFEILDAGEHTHKRVLFPLRAVPKGAAPTPGYDLVKAFAVATGRKPPADLWRWRPRRFLSECVFDAQIRTIERDSKGHPVHPVLRYSRIERLIERIAGTPPCLRVDSQ